MNFAASTLELSLECFEGPLPALVALIKKNKVSIWDIPISTLTERFLEYVELARDLRLKIAEDFIDIASLLILIKSKMLLPAENNGDDPEDPREELVERIIEYERFRAMANTLDGFPILHRDVFCREQQPLNGDIDYDLLSLCTVFFNLMRNGEERYISVNDIRPTLEEQLQILKATLDSTGLFEWNPKDGQEYRVKIATVLGILELTKTKQARLYQRRPFGSILLKKNF